MIYAETKTPIALAAKLAEYISDPSTIRARVKDHFGRAPSVDYCAKLRRKAEKTRAPWLGSKFLDDKFKIHCATHNGPYELDADGYDRCTVCKAEKAKAAEAKAALEAAKAIELAATRERAERERRERELARLEAIRAELLNAGNAIAGADRPVLFQDLILAVAAAFEITPADIMGGCRERVYVDARTALAKILRLRGSSYPMIAKRMDRDHSTILNLLRTYDVRAKRAPLIADVVERLV